MTQCRTLGATNVVLPTVSPLPSSPNLFQSECHSDPWILRIPQDILLHIVRMIPPVDLINFQDASPHLQNIVVRHALIKARQLLKHFDIPDPVYFASQLKAHGAVIAGPSTLPVLHDQLPFQKELHIWVEGSDLPRIEEYFDDYVPVNKHVDRKDMCEAIGFDHWGTSVAAVTRFRNELSDREILFVECTEPPVAVLTSAPSTLYMNFIAHDGFYSLYPRLTGQSCGFITMPKSSSAPHSTPAIGLLDDLGFTHHADLMDAIGPHDCGNDPSCPARIREFCDPSVLRIAFPQNWRLETRASPAVNASESAAQLPVIWRLRAGVGCGRCVGFPGFHGRVDGSKLVSLRIGMSFRRLFI